MALSSGYRRAALLVDFDNIYSSLRSVDPAAAHTFATDPKRWANWIEERLGAVGPDADESTPRVVLHRTCYLNPSAWGSYRAYFTRAGFRVVDCPALTQQGKNSADIHMVIDALDLLVHPTRYDEFFVLSLDADFTPLFQRLRSFDRRVIMLGSGPSAAALRNSCDYVIPDEVFISEALLDEEPAAEEVAVEEGTVDSMISSQVLQSASVQASASAPMPAATPAPAVSVIDGTASTDPAQMRGALCAALVELVSEAPEPVPMAFAASALRNRFSPEVTARHWAGKGGFKAFVHSICDERLAYRISGVIGFVYQPGRHDIDAAMERAEEARSLRSRSPDTSRFVGPWADAAARICRVLGFPALLPSEWAAVFTGIADELTMHGFQDMASLERVVAGPATELRAPVRFVGVGLSQAGYELSSRGEHTPKEVGGCFHNNMLRLAENAQLPLDDADRVALRDWLLGGFNNTE